MHFSIIVAGDNWEEQLAPFQENNMDDCQNFVKMQENSRQNKRM